MRTKTIAHLACMTPEKIATEVEEEEKLEETNTGESPSVGE